MVNVPADPVEVNPSQPATVLPALPHTPQVMAQGLAAKGEMVLLGYDHLPPGQSTDYSLTGYHGLYLSQGPATFYGSAYPLSWVNRWAKLTCGTV